jgi:hypothetical protein
VQNHIVWQGEMTPDWGGIRVIVEDSPCARVHRSLPFISLSLNPHLKPILGKVFQRTTGTAIGR